MPDSDVNEPSNADLEARIDQLEATIEKMMPTRRGVLTGLAGAGIGGAAVYGASDPARAQAAGQVGTDTDPVDVEAWNLNVANQVTSDLAMGGNDVTDVGAMDVKEIDTDAGGDGYSWDNVTASRSLNTWYQAPPRDIEVVVGVNVEDGSQRSRVSVKIGTAQDADLPGLEWRVEAGANETNNREIIGPFTIPANQYYALDLAEGDVSVRVWGELR